MKLRDHPSISYRSFRTWPPVWTQKEGSYVKTLFGEIGVLTSVSLSDGPSAQCDLLIDYESQPFSGSLLFDSRDVCGQICTVLQANVGRSIKEIGDLDLALTV